MSASEMLFSFRGRLNRAPYWIIGLCYVAVLLGLGIIGFLIGLDRGLQEPTLAVVILLIAYVVIYVGFLYSAVAVAVKRLHDRNKSGWWILLFYFVPGILTSGGEASGDVAIRAILSLIGAAISIWALIELGFLRGTRGPNYYGPDPLG